MKHFQPARITGRSQPEFPVSGRHLPGKLIRLPGQPSYALGLLIVFLLFLLILLDCLLLLAFLLVFFSAFIAHVKYSSYQKW